MRLRISVRGRVRPSVRPSSGPLLFSNDENRHFLNSDDDETWRGPRDSQGQFIINIKMSVRRFVPPSDIILREESERK